MSVSSIFDEYNLPKLLGKDQEKITISPVQEKIEISFSCRNLRIPEQDAPISSQIKVSVENDGQKRFVGETEIAKKTANPKFTGTFSSDYYFEIRQDLSIDVMVIRRQTWELLGSVTTTLAAIVGQMNKAAEFDIQKDGQVFGKLIIESEKSVGSNSVAHLQFHGRKLKNMNGWLNKNNPFFKMYKTQAAEQDTLVYESEILKKESSPDWQPCEVFLHALCNNDTSHPIKVEVFSQNKAKDRNKLIGECKFTIDDLKSQHELDLPLAKPQKPKKIRGVLQIRDFHIKEKPGFLDYLKGGLQVKPIFAVDFTSSNKEYTNSNSLHVIRKAGGLNPYQKVINSLCEIILNYNFDKNAALLGFGGKPLGHAHTSHAFSLNGQEDNPWVPTTPNILETYKKAVYEVTLGGPTCFEHILRKTMKIAKASKDQGSTTYYLLFILTDGLIHDMEQTLNCLVEAAKLPLSVIIVGIGDADLKKLDVFNGEGDLYNSAGDKVDRKLHQFYSFGRFGNEEELLQTVLKDIPKQVATYMDKMNIEPLQKDSIEKITNTKVMQDITNQTNNEGSMTLGLGLGKSDYSSLPVLDQENRI